MDDAVSRTALGSAYFRDAHLRLDPPPWVLEDHIASMLLTDDEVADLERPLRDWPADVLIASRVQHVVRTRLAEDTAVAGLDEGRSSYVLLGAGADTFAWRHPEASRFTVHEYDLPATQAWKRAALRRAGLAEPDNVRFSTIDLTGDAFGDLPRQATWSWLGVTMYLPVEAMMQTLRAVTACGADTTLVVNFALPAEERDDLGRKTMRNAESLVASVGEPVVERYGREAVHDALRSAGFASVDLLDAEQLADRYLAGRRDLHLPGGMIIAIAST
jgi:methyltransferase (TIGR00027 family)